MSPATNIQKDNVSFNPVRIKVDYLNIKCNWKHYIYIYIYLYIYTRSLAEISYIGDIGFLQPLGPGKFR